MRILLTGHTGFVGRAVAAGLTAAGHEVVGLSRRNSPPPGGGGEALAADISDAALGARARAALAPCQAIVHAAASLSMDDLDPAVTQVNCLGLQHVLALARDWEAESFIFLSSLPVIGVPHHLPVTESHPAAPQSAYHASKLFGEQLVGLGCAGRPVRGVSLRITSPVGPGLPEGRILSVFVHRALAGEPLEVAGEGSREQDYVDVRDVAVAVEQALQRPVRGVFNVASGRPVSNLELARRCVALCSSASPIRRHGSDPQEGLRWRVSIDLARRELGFEPRHTLDEAIRAAAEERHG